MTETTEANLSDARIKGILKKLLVDLRVLTKANHRYEGVGAADLQHDLLKKVNACEYLLKNGRNPGASM
jgi:hypothetical protein